MQRIEATSIPLGGSGSLRGQTRLWRWRLLRRQVLVERACQARRTAPGSPGENPHDEQRPRGGGGHHIALLNEPAWFQGTLAVDADLASGDGTRGSRMRLYQPCAPQPFVEPLLRHRCYQLPSGRRTVRRPLSAASAAKGECSTDLLRSGLVWLAG